MQPAYVFSTHLFKVFKGQEVIHEVRYAEHPALRQKVAELLDELVQESQRTVFASVCGRCGNSCRRPDILVREHEILPISQALGRNAAEVVERHLTGARTWNPRDGLLVLQEGACPFLKAGAEPHPDSATCTIYEVRPASCRNFKSSASFCQKSPGSLIEQLELVRLTEEQCELSLKSGEIHQLETSWYERLHSQLRGLELEPKRGFAQLVELISQLVELHEKSFPPEDIDEFKSELTTLRANIQSAADLGEKDARRAAQVEELWLKLGNLEARLAQELAQPEEPEDQPEEQRRDSLIRELAVSEPGVALRFEAPSQAQGEAEGHQVTVALSFEEYPDLLDSARAVLARFLQADDGLHQVQLTETNPPCFMCGECCRTYDVEIRPSDIRRLCQLLEISTDEFIERYTLPGRFNWNPYNRILKKVPRQRYRPLVKSLPIAGQANQAGDDPTHEMRECSFLEQRDDGYFYCSVHSHKPDICRNYTARNTLCRQTNRGQHHGRQAGVLAWVSIDRERIQGRTWRGDHDQGKLRLERAQWPDLDNAARQLEAQAEELLQRHAARWIEQN